MSQGGIKSFYYSRSFLLIIFVIIIFFLGSTIKDYYSQEDLREDISTLDLQIHDLESQQADLIANLTQVQSEDFVETEARTRLNLRKPGEKVIIVSSNEDVQKINNEATGNSIKDLLKTPDSNPQKWWSYFFTSI